VGLLELRSFRPLPRHDLRTALDTIRTVSVLDRADSPGGAPPLFAELAAALHGTEIELRSFVYGLGGRDLHPEEIRAVFTEGSGSYIGLRGAPCPA
jgi:pyruvate ferredoxin oxidoreductase alpha subunit